MAESAILFDVRHLPFEGWGWAGMGLLLLCIAALARTQAHSKDLRGWPAWFASGFGTLMVATSAWMYRDTWQLRHAGALEGVSVVQGRLDEARHWTSKKDFKEQLRIGAQQFQYADRDTASPYPMLQGPGALARGDLLRITHLHGRILKIERLAFPPLLEEPR